MATASGIKQTILVLNASPLQPKVRWLPLQCSIMTVEGLRLIDVACVNIFLYRTGAAPQLCMDTCSEQELNVHACVCTLLWCTWRIRAGLSVYLKTHLKCLTLVTSIWSVSTMNTCVSTFKTTRHKPEPRPSCSKGVLWIKIIWLLKSLIFLISRIM